MPNSISIEEPNPKQVIFLKVKNRFIAFGGSRGGGKSWAVRKKSMLMAVNYPEIKILILRRTFPELRENHILPMLIELKGLARYKETDKSFIFPNGSRIRFGYCDTETDVLQYQGQEFDIIFIDEATQFSEFQFNTLTACMRGANELPKRMYLTCNPGGVGHDWVKRLFIDKEYRNSEHADDYLFIPARVYDNKALIEKDKGYVSMLENLPEDLRKAWLEGDWNIFAGQFFKEFRDDIHVCEPFEIPNHWNRYCSIDYGLDMFACLWYARDPQGNVFIYKELHEDNLIVSEACQRWKENNAGDKIKSIFAPVDLWNRRNDTGRSAFDIFLEHGMVLVKSNNNRINGWLAVKDWIRVKESRDELTGETVKTSSLRIFCNCRTLIKYLPSVQMDSRKPNDVATEPHIYTHIVDALRYFCIMWTRPSREPKTIKNQHEQHIAKIIRKKRQRERELV